MFGLSQKEWMGNWQRPFNCCSSVKALWSLPRRLPAPRPPPDSWPRGSTTPIDNRKNVLRQAFLDEASEDKLVCQRKNTQFQGGESCVRQSVSRTCSLSFSR